MAKGWEGMNNSRRADLGSDAIWAAAEQTNVAVVDSTETAIVDVLAYVAHFCNRCGLDPESMFARGLRSYQGDEEDGPYVAATLDPSRPMAEISGHLPPPAPEPTWSAPAGVLWCGPDTEVQREDVPEHDGQTREPLYKGDMDAALAVARETNCPWLSYAPQLVGKDESDSFPWQVFAHATQEDAEKSARDYDIGSFAWDGRLGAPPEHPSGVGFRHHPQAIYVQGEF